MLLFTAFCSSMHIRQSSSLVWTYQAFLIVVFISVPAVEKIQVAVPLFQTEIVKLSDDMVTVYRVTAYLVSGFELVGTAICFII